METNQNTKDLNVAAFEQRHFINRVNIRIKKLTECLTQLQSYLNTVALALDNRANEKLKQLLSKRLEKMTQRVNNFKANVDKITNQPINFKLADELTDIRLLIERLISNIKNDACKKMPPQKHFELLIDSAREHILNHLNLLNRYANWLYYLPGEPEPNPQVIAKTQQLQEEQKQAEHSLEFQSALEKIAALGKMRNATIGCFISYAWPSDDRPWEKWIQPFLKLMCKHLEKAGITPFLDIQNSPRGFNSHEHMDRILTSCRKIILIGTESLMDKFRMGVSSICYELSMIQQRRRADEKLARYNVIPLIISGEMETALPAQFERFTVIKHCGGDYIDSLKDVIRQLYDFGEQHAEYNVCWNNVIARPEKQTISFDSIKLNSVDKGEESAADSSSVILKNSQAGYLEKLTTVYQDKAFSGVQRLFDDEVMSIEDYYVNLALIKEEEQKKKEQTQKDNKITENDVINRDEATELLGSAEQFFSVQEPIELKNIFDQKDNEKARQTNRLLIIGRAGIGKTTLCQYIVNQWACGKLWNERYQGIFRIPLRNLIASRYNANRDYSLVEIINRECFIDRLTADEQAQLETELKNHPEKYLIILDGYDELSTQTEDAYLINQVESLLQYPEVIVTSRPQTVHFAADRKLEVLGFTDENIERYVEHFLKDNEQTKTHLKQQLKEQSLLQSLAHIPLNLELICSAWQKNNWTEELSLTELYQHLVEWLTYRYLKKFHPDYKQSQKQQALENLTASHKEKLCEVWLKHLEEIAWKMRQAGEIYINKKELFSTENNLQKREENIKQLRESGLLRQTLDKQFYYFSHLTFQEFFAARHAVKVIQNAGSQSNVDYEMFQAFFKENKFNPQLQIVWWFIAGLLKDDSKALEHYFHLLLQEPRDITVIGELPLFMHCLEQCDLAKNSGVGKKVMEYVVSIIIVILRSESSNAVLENNLSKHLVICSKLVRENIIPQLLILLKNSSAKSEWRLDMLGEKAMSPEIIHLLIAMQEKFNVDEVNRVERIVVSTLTRLALKINTQTLVEELSIVLNSRNNHHKEIAVEVLGSISREKYTENIVALLLPVLNDDNLLVKKTVLNVLCKIKWASIKPELIETLTNKLLHFLKNSTETAIKIIVMNVLIAIGTKAISSDIVNALLTLLKSVDFNNKELIDSDVYENGFLSRIANVLLIANTMKDKIIEEMGQLIIALSDHNFTGLRSCIYSYIKHLNEDSEEDKINKIKFLFNLYRNEPQPFARDSIYRSLGELGKEINSINIAEEILDFILTSRINLARSHALFFLCKSKNFTLDHMQKISEYILSNWVDMDYKIEPIYRILICVLQEIEKILVRIDEYSALAELKRKKYVSLLNILSDRSIGQSIQRLLQAELNDVDGNQKNSAILHLKNMEPNVINEELVQQLLSGINDDRLKGYAWMCCQSASKLNSLMQQSAADLIPLLIQALHGPQNDLAEIAFRYLLDQCCDFKFTNVIANANKLVFIINKNSNVTVGISAGIFQKLVFAVLKKIKEAQKITPFLLPQSQLSITLLMQAASKGNLELVNDLLIKGIDTRCVDQTGMMAVNHAYDYLPVLKMLIKNHQPIEQLFLENYLSELDFYHGDVNNKKDDEALLDKLMMLLTGMEDTGEKKQVQRKRLLAHFQSFSDNNSQVLEGLIGQEFLALHTRHLLQLLAEVNCGMHDHQFESNQRLSIISYLKRELLITVQAFHFDVLSNIANSKNSNELRESVAKALLNALGNLAPGEELIYQTGYTQHPVGHCVYVAFVRINDQLVVRVDNLWEPDIKNRHELSDLSHHTRKEKYKSYFIGCFSHANLQSNKDLLNYLIGIIAAKELLPSEALPKLYPMVKQSSALALNYLNQWPAKRIQIVGNCVVRSFFVGAHIRLGKKLHHLFRSWESNLLTNGLGAELVSNASTSSSSTNSILRGEVMQTISPVVNISSHEALMQTLASELNLDYQRDVFSGSVIEQTLIDLTGINVQQNNPAFRRNKDDQSTRFYLNFPDEKSKQVFVDFYQANYQGIILRVLTEENKTSIDFDTLLFFQKIIPVMKQHLQAKKALIQQASQPRSVAELISAQGMLASNAQKKASTTSVKNENTCLVM